MSKIGVWMDERHAVIVKIFNESMREPKIEHLVAAPEPVYEREHGEYDDSHKDMERREHGLKAFFTEILSHLSIAESLVLLGPSKAKIRFQHELESKHPQLAAMVVGTLPAEKMPEGKLVAQVREVFHKKAPRWLLSSNRRGNRSGSLKHNLFLKTKADQDSY